MNIFEIRRIAANVCMAVAVMAGMVACGGGGRQPLEGSPTATDITSAPASAENPGAASTPSNQNPPRQTMREKIEELERDGKIRKLDRTDSLTGVDQNRNAVRDDIESFINELPSSDVQKKAAMQVARALQATLLVDLTDRPALQKAGEGTMAAIHCLASRAPKDFSDIGDKVQSMTANTKLRLRRYAQYNAARSGSVTSMPTHDTCE